MKLALFFTEAYSVRKWHEAGLVLRDSLLYERLCEQGHEVYFVTYGDEDDYRYLPAGSRIKVLSKPKGMTNGQYGWRIPVVHRDVLSKVDVIKSHQVDGARFAAWCKLRLRKPYIARCGYLVSAFMARLGTSRRERVKKWAEEAFAFHVADAVCVPSRAGIEYLRRRYRINPDKAHACPNWIDTERFKPDAGLTKHPRRVCFVARFHRQKQPLLLLEALKGIDDVELLMIGGGPLKPQVEAKIQEYGLKATILDRVPNEDLPGYYNSSVVYMLPTLIEGGSPKTLLEAMSCEIPVVSTNAFGVDEVFEDGKHGFKCDPDDVRAFRAAIEALLDNPALGRQMGQRGRQHVIENYSIERALDREIGILGGLSST
jgi:glycosyltransferase involved in cell wall biosynthesis